VGKNGLEWARWRALLSAVEPSGYVAVCVVIFLK
jgi:hypothetical protein